MNNTKYSSEIDSIQKMEHIILKSLLIYTYLEMHNLNFLTTGPVPFLFNTEPSITIEYFQLFPFLGYPTKGLIQYRLARLLGRFTSQFQRPKINRYNIVDHGYNRITLICFENRSLVLHRAPGEICGTDQRPLVFLHKLELPHGLSITLYLFI